MLNVPSQMKPTLNRWKQDQNLGEGQKFGTTVRVTQYEQMMDQLVLADNGEDDSAHESGLIVSKADGETIRFQGDSKKGSMEAVTPDGRVVALNFNEKAVDFLQLTGKANGVEALHEHHDRNTGKGWMQLGGAVTVIDMDQPGALEGLFRLDPAAAPLPTKSGKAELVGQGLATKLGVAADQVKVAGFDPQKGFNAGDCGFPVNGELQMSAWTQGLEARFEVGGQKFVYRGLDEKSGRYGQDVEHQGYWKADERGVYVPDASAPKEEYW